MRVRAEVIGRPLDMPFGGRYHVGERLWLDTDLPRDREAIESGFVRVLPTTTETVAAAVLDPPADRMIHGPGEARQPSAAVKSKKRPA